MQTSEPRESPLGPCADPPVPEESGDSSSRRRLAVGLVSFGSLGLLAGLAITSGDVEESLPVAAVRWMAFLAMGLIGAGVARILSRRGSPAPAVTFCILVVLVSAGHLNRWIRIRAREDNARALRNLRREVVAIADEALAGGDASSPEDRAERFQAALQRAQAEGHGEMSTVMRISLDLARDMNAVAAECRRRIAPYAENGCPAWSRAARPEDMDAHLRSLDTALEGMRKLVEAQNALPATLRDRLAGAGIPAEAREQYLVGVASGRCALVWAANRSYMEVLRAWREQAELLRAHFGRWKAGERGDLEFRDAGVRETYARLSREAEEARATRDALWRGYLQAVRR